MAVRENSRPDSPVIRGGPLFLAALGLAGVALFPGTGWTAPAKGADGNPIHMMFVPSGEAQVILEGGEEVGRRLEAITGLRFRVSVATSYAAAVEALGAGRVDVGWLATLSYVLA
ncbi:MAG: PhnD/SsuA/transferrin family substrate-binding protein, partial [Nitrospinaceae bacterium]